MVQIARRFSHEKLMTGNSFKTRLFVERYCL